MQHNLRGGTHTLKPELSAGTIPATQWYMTLSAPVSSRRAWRPHRLVGWEPSMRHHHMSCTVAARLMHLKPLPKPNLVILFASYVNNKKGRFSSNIYHVPNTVSALQLLTHLILKTQWGTEGLSHASESWTGLEHRTPGSSQWCPSQSASMATLTSQSNHKAWLIPSSHWF